MLKPRVFTIKIKLNYIYNIVRMYKYKNHNMKINNYI